MRSCYNKDVFKYIKKGIIKVLKRSLNDFSFSVSNLSGSAPNLKQLIHHNIGNSYLILVVKHM